MTKQETINELHEQLKATRRYVSDIKYRHDRAINALSQLSRGLGRKTDSSDWYHSMQKLAAEELADIAKLPLREP